ncbi:MAG: sugar phosphate isomerase/epimerase [Planctomycetes bacterium]|nr:sugar phosphate isomerase/epimerase [Planctomycetota bacterium]MBL7044176.1 sugar phosphate isomerase/epimerase [Pirellulaceae bacterium]
MKIGLMNRPWKNLSREIDWIGQREFEFVDLILGPPAADLDEIDAGTVRAALEEHDLGVVVQTPSFIPVGSPLAPTRRSALEELRQCLQVARQIGAPTLSVHFAYPDGSFAVSDVVAWHVETLAPLAEEAADAEVTILLENASHGGHHQLNYILTVMEQVPRLGFHLSSGHAKLELEYDRFDEYLKRLGHRLQHVQLSDNDGTADQHLPLGCAPRSTVNWPRRIQQLKSSGYDGTITLKVFSPEPEYLHVSRTLLQKWWNQASATTHTGKRNSTWDSGSPVRIQTSQIPPDECYLDVAANAPYMDR